MALNLKPLPEFNPDGEVGSSLAARWRLWLRDFDTFLIASGIRDATRKRALLLYQAGSRVREIFHQLEDVGTDAEYDTARDKLTAYFEPQKISDMRSRLRSAKGSKGANEKLEVV